MADRIAADVATESSYVAGTDPDALEAELETRLIRAAARSFVQRVNSQVAWAGGMRGLNSGLVGRAGSPLPNRVDGDPMYDPANGGDQALSRPAATWRSPLSGWPPRRRLAPADQGGVRSARRIPVAAVAT